MIYAENYEQFICLDINHSLLYVFNLHLFQLYICTSTGVNILSKLKCPVFSNCGHAVNVFEFINIVQYCMYTQRIIRSVCASTQADQRLRCQPKYALDHWLPTECHAETERTAHMQSWSKYFSPSLFDLFSSDQQIKKEDAIQSF